MSKDMRQEMRCMLIPLRYGRMLLPTAVVAEIIGYREPDASAEAPLWVQGKVNWHQRSIPVVDFERLLGSPDTFGSVRQRIAVCYSLHPERGWPLIGFVAQGIPRLLRLDAGLVESARAGEPGLTPVRLQLSIGGESLLVPDIEYLQAHLPALRDAQVGL